MVDAMDMPTPLEQRLAQLATKADLEIWVEALHMALKADLEILGNALVERFRTELARQLQELQKTVSAQISAMKARRADLPARVSRPETAVLAPKPR
jgi:hypothetical protein